MLARERRSLDILSVKKDVKQSASDVPGLGVDDGKGEEDLQYRSLESRGNDTNVSIKIDSRLQNRQH